MNLGRAIWIVGNDSINTHGYKLLHLVRGINRPWNPLHAFGVTKLNHFFRQLLITRTVNRWDEPQGIQYKLWLFRFHEGR